MGACVLSNKSQMSMVPLDLAMKNTPGLVGDHSASETRAENDLVCNRAPFFKSNRLNQHKCLNKKSNILLTNIFSRQMLKPLPPATNKISLKKGERFIATIGPSKIALNHSAFDALMKEN
jgi:hypothetical protein